MSGVKFTASVTALILQEWWKHNLGGSNNNLRCSQCWQQGKVYGGVMTEVSGHPGVATWHQATALSLPATSATRWPGSFKIVFRPPPPKENNGNRSQPEVQSTAFSLQSPVTHVVRISTNDPIPKVFWCNYCVKEATQWKRLTGMQSGVCICPAHTSPTLLSYHNQVVGCSVAAWKCSDLAMV